MSKFTELKPVQKAKGALVSAMERWRFFSLKRKTDSRPGHSDSLPPASEVVALSALPEKFLERAPRNGVVFGSLMAGEHHTLSVDISTSSGKSLKTDVPAGENNGEALAVPFNLQLPAGLLIKFVRQAPRSPFSHNAPGTVAFGFVQHDTTLQDLKLSSVNLVYSWPDGPQYELYKRLKFQFTEAWTSRDPSGYAIAESMRDKLQVPVSRIRAALQIDLNVLPDSDLKAELSKRYTDSN